jgi:spermidine synthase
MRFRLTLVVAALSGFVALSYEILWFRVYSFATGASPSAFGLLLGYYLAGLAAGAYLSGRICSGAVRTSNRNARVLVTAAFAGVVIGYAVVPTFAALAARGVVDAGLLVVLLAAMCFGAQLPMISHLGVAPDQKSGERVSRVYLANIAGSASGTLLTGYVLLDRFSTSQLALGLASAALGLVIALAFFVDGNTRWRRWATAATLLSACALITAHQSLFNRLYERLLFKDSNRGTKFSDLVENRHGVIAVLGHLRVFGGGAYDGAISTDLVDDRNLLIRAFTAVALHPRPREVLMIGLATGAWAQIVANSDEVEHLTVVEINPGYLRLIARYPQVRGLLSNPKVTVVIDDGRRWLARNGERRYDLVVQNTTEHWRANTTNLLSREYLELVRQHLNPAGILIYNTTSSEDAYKTAFSVYPFGLRVVNFVAVSDSAFALEPNHWAHCLRNWRVDGRPVLDLSRPRDRQKLDSLAAFAASLDRPPEFLGLESREHMLTRLRSASVITDDNMLPEWRVLLLPDR